MKPRVYADFNDWDGDSISRFLFLQHRGTVEDLARQGIILEEGLELVFYMDDADEHGNPDDLEADGKCHFHANYQCWVGRIEWNLIRHASDIQLLYDHIVTKSPLGVTYSEAIKLMLCLYCTLNPLPAELQKLKLSKGALAEIFSKLATNGKILLDEEEQILPSDITSTRHWEDLTWKLLHDQIAPDLSFLARASRYV
jgi:hypothetical protein